MQIQIIIVCWPFKFQRMGHRRFCYVPKSFWGTMHINQAKSVDSPSQTWGQNFRLASRFAFGDLFWVFGVYTSFVYSITMRDYMGTLICLFIFNYEWTNIRYWVNVKRTWSFNKPLLIIIPCLNFLYQVRGL